MAIQAYANLSSPGSMGGFFHMMYDHKPKSGAGAADPIHPTPRHAMGLGCFAATPILNGLRLCDSAPGCGVTQDSVAGPGDAGEVVAAPKGWCVNANVARGMDQDIVENSGWAAASGQNGLKRWYQASGVGSRLVLQRPAGHARRILLEYYAHQSIATMGVIRARVRYQAKVNGTGSEWMALASTQVDGRCVEGCPPHQGFYFMAPLADLPSQRHSAHEHESEPSRNLVEIVLEVIPRTPADCVGNFSIVALIGDTM